jgi:hypothetical protein
MNFMALKFDVFLLQALTLGGDWVFNVPNILEGEPEFNYFFGVVMAFGLVCVPVAILVRLISKS